MKYLNTILVEDELQNRKLMEQLLSSYCPTVRLIAQCGSFAEAKKVLPTTPADLLFLDIELDRGNSLELLEAIDLGETQVIFVTAHKEYATRVFKYNTTDYLLKPLDIEELVAAVQRAYLRMEKEEYLQKEQVEELKGKKDPKAFDFIPIANMDKVNFVKIKEV
jgi:two-component system, LytTR family, response regulator